MPQITQPAPNRHLTRLAFILATTAFAISTAGAADPSPANAAGKKLFETKCLRCHDELDPSAYEEMAWKRWLAKMKDKARLDNEQYGDVSDYLKGVREAAKAKKAK